MAVVNRGLVRGLSVYIFTNGIELKRVGLSKPEVLVSISGEMQISNLYRKVMRTTKRQGNPQKLS